MFNNMLCIKQRMIKNIIFHNIKVKTFIKFQRRSTFNICFMVLVDLLKLRLIILNKLHVRRVNNSSFWIFQIRFLLLQFNQTFLIFRWLPFQREYWFCLTSHIIAIHTVHIFQIMEAIFTFESIMAIINIILTWFLIIFQYWRIKRNRASLHKSLRIILVAKDWILLRFLGLFDA